MSVLSSQLSSQAIRSAEASVSIASHPQADQSFSGELVDVMFPLIGDDEWPPYPAEMVEAKLIAHDLAEIVGVPWFVTNISRGDVISVDHDGIGYVARTVMVRGGHSTLHVMATTDAELAPIIEQLRALGASTFAGLEPPMLTVDVPENASLDDVIDVLSAAESMTCAYTIASGQHRTRNRSAIAS